MLYTALASGRFLHKSADSIEPRKRSFYRLVQPKHPPSNPLRKTRGWHPILAPNKPPQHGSVKTISSALPSSKIVAADETPRSLPCLCRSQRLFVFCWPGVPGSLNSIICELAHKRNHLEIRESSHRLTGWERNGCRRPRQVFQPLQLGHMAYHRSRT